MTWANVSWRLSSSPGRLATDGRGVSSVRPEDGAGDRRLGDPSAWVQGLRACMGQGFGQQQLWTLTAGGREGWFAYAPGMEEGEDFVDED